MNSIMLLEGSLQCKLKTQSYLLSCIETEEKELEGEKDTLSSENYNEELAELLEYKEDILSELTKCQEALKVSEKNNKKIVLKREVFKKGGQSW